MRRGELARRGTLRADVVLARSRIGADHGGAAVPIQLRLCSARAGCSRRWNEGRPLGRAVERFAIWCGIAPVFVAGLPATIAVLGGVRGVARRRSVPGRVLFFEKYSVNSQAAVHLFVPAGKQPIGGDGTVRRSASIGADRTVVPVRLGKQRIHRLSTVCGANVRWRGIGALWMHRRSCGMSS